MRELESAIPLVQPHRSLRSLLVGVALVAGLLAGCAPVERATRYPQRPAPGTTAPAPRTEAPPEPTRPSYDFPGTEGFARSPEEISGPAVLKLMDQARDQMNAGLAEQAVASLETALNIEPRNPFVRQQLAAAHLQQRLPDQAENQAQRSNSFARGNPFIEVENWRVIAAARQARGDLAGAREARERMAEIQAHLGD